MRAARHLQMQSKIERHHLLRAIYELLEGLGRSQQLEANTESPPVQLHHLAAMRSWSMRQLNSSIRRAHSQGLLFRDKAGQVRLTQQGFREAEKLTYDHRLWELFLSRYADIAPSLVDRAADAIEHVLDSEMIAELESLMPRSKDGQSVPSSLHPTLAMQLKK